MGILDAIERLWGLSVTAFALSYVLGAVVSEIAAYRGRRASPHPPRPDRPPERRAARLARRLWGWEIDGGSRR